MSIDARPEQEAKVRKDLNFHSAPLPPVHPIAPILKILKILKILLQTVDIKVLTDLYALLPRRCYRH